MSPQVLKYILNHQGDHFRHFIFGLPAKGFPGFPGIAPAYGNFGGPKQSRVYDHMLVPVQTELNNLCAEQ